MDQDFSLPQLFQERILATYGAENGKDFLKAVAGKPAVSIRINPRKKWTLPEAYSVPWCKTGYYLPQRPEFIFDPHFHGGCYYVQESSSMFLEKALSATRLPPDPLVLDLCASPGGKTTHLLSWLPDTALVHANEVIHSRIPALKENIIRWGQPNVIITKADPAQFETLHELYDLVLVDAPCSGEGLFRKDPAAVNQWSPANLLTCELRQRRILESAVKTVRKGGYLIYSTCTFNPGENENQIDYLLQNGFEYIPILEAESLPEITRIRVNEAEKGYAFHPHRTRGEGFFLVLLRKISEHSQIDEKNKGRNFFEKKIPIPTALNDFIGEAEKWCAFQKKEFLFLIPSAWEKTIAMITSELPTVYAGTEAAIQKAGDWIPRHPLSLSTLLSDKTPSIELSREEALKFLKKESLSGRDIPKGYYAVQFEGTALGWVKAIPGRLNNLLPPEFRIRKNLTEY